MEYTTKGADTLNPTSAVFEVRVPMTHMQADLTRAAVQLQRSMLRKVLPLGGPDGARVAASEDLQVHIQPQIRPGIEVASL